jgi:hypothetical protein
MVGIWTSDQGPYGVGRIFLMLLPESDREVDRRGVCAPVVGLEILVFAVGFSGGFVI